MTITNELRNNRQRIAGYTNMLRQLGEELPAPAAVTAIPSLPTRQEVALAAMQVIENGKDPASDKEVQRLVTGWQLSQAGIQDAAELEASKANLRAVREHANSLIPKLNDRFNNAITVLREALPKLGNIDLSEGATIRQGTPPILAAEILAAAGALQEADSIRRSWRLILEIAGEPTTNNDKGHGTRLLWCKPTLEQWNTNRLDSRHTTDQHGKNHSLWTLIQNGVTIELATTTAEWRERLDNLTHAQEAAERRAALEERERTQHSWRR